MALLNYKEQQMEFIESMEDNDMDVHIQTFRLRGTSSRFFSFQGIDAGVLMFIDSVCGFCDVEFV